MAILMEQVVSKCGDFSSDLESGKPPLTETKNHGKETTFSGAKEEITHLFPTPSYTRGSCNGVFQCEPRVVASSIPSNSCDCPTEHVQVVVDRMTVVGEKKSSILEKKNDNETRKAKSAKKPPKPPRPPRGLSLDSTDQKLIRELAEIARLKRARIERMKALKRMKETNTSSSKNQLLAMSFTILFCLVILFQGISSRTSSAAGTYGSFMATEMKRAGILSMVHYPSAYKSIADEPGSVYPSFAEQNSHYNKKVGRSMG